MFKSAIRAAPRRVLLSRSLVNGNSTRRFLSTAPPSQKSRSWKSSAARWALAAGGIYYYNTSNVFAEEPDAAIQQLGESIHHMAESRLPTVDAVVEEKRRREAQSVVEDHKERQAAREALSGDGQETEQQEASEGMGGMEDEADQQGAFNPETGEINWDCPCLGGMAHGPCGEEFKAAFSCFVYSKEEPKGMECIEKFKGMQDCFREHPDVYGSELEDDEDDVEEELNARDATNASDSSSPSSNSEESSPTPNQALSTESKLTVEKPHHDIRSTAASAVQASEDESKKSVAKATHDTPSK